MCLVTTQSFHLSLSSHFRIISIDFLLFLLFTLKYISLNVMVSFLYVFWPLYKWNNIFNIYSFVCGFFQSALCLWNLLKLLLLWFSLFLYPYRECIYLLFSNDEIQKCFCIAYYKTPVTNLSDLTDYLWSMDHQLVITAYGIFM